MKPIDSTLFKCSILFLFLFSYGCTKTEDTITLIPYDYKGTVRINFNQENGKKEMYEGKIRIYQIPTDGTLRTQFKEQYGWHYPKYFYVGDENGRIPIQSLPQLIPEVLDTLDTNKTYAYNFMHLGNTIKVDSLGNETNLNNAAIIFTVGNPLID